MYLILSCFLLAFTSSFANNYGPYKIGKPYKIGNVEYVPTEVKSYKESGVASWYGREFHGKLTANGAVFNANLYTAAHKILPMPSAVLITNLANNKKVIAIINDRGPFSTEEDRVIDVSSAVAKKLDFINAGRANVTVEYLPELSEKLKKNDPINIAEYSKMYESVTNKNTNWSRVAKIQNSIEIDTQIESAAKIGKTAFTKNYIKAFYVQVGVFQVLANAQKIYTNLASIDKIQLRSENHDAKNYYIVRSGPFKSISEAEQSKYEIKSQCKICEPMIVII